MKEDFRGVGNLFLNGSLIEADVHYAVNVDRSGHLARITGRLRIDPIMTGLKLMSIDEMGRPNSDLVLVLEDGRKWHCVLVNNSGALLNRNGFEDAHQGPAA